MLSHQGTFRSVPVHQAQNVYGCSGVKDLLQTVKLVCVFEFISTTNSLESNKVSASVLLEKDLRKLLLKLLECVHWQTMTTVDLLVQFINTYTP